MHCHLPAKHALVARALTCGSTWSWQTGDRERVKSVLADLQKTSNDFRQLSTKALEQLSDALMPRLRGPLDEVGGGAEPGSCTARTACGLLPLS